MKGYGKSGYHARRNFAGSAGANILEKRLLQAVAVGVDGGKLGSKLWRGACKMVNILIRSRLRKGLQNLS